MSLPFLNVVEVWSSKKSPYGNGRITALLMGMMLFILLFTLASFAFISTGDQLDGDDLSFLEFLSSDGLPIYLPLFVLPIGLELGVLFTVLRLEYLQSHIGEKLPSGSMIQSTMFAWLSSVTAQFYCVVTFLSSVRTFAATRSGSVFAREGVHLSRGESFFIFIGGLISMARAIRFRSLKKNILIQGGLLPCVGS